jgi:hypothetical protein
MESSLHTTVVIGGVCVYRCLQIIVIPQALFLNSVIIVDYTVGWLSDMLFVWNSIDASAFISRRVWSLETCKDVRDGVLHSFRRSAFVGCRRRDRPNPAFADSTVRFRSNRRAHSVMDNVGHFH